LRAAPSRLQTREQAADIRSIAGPSNREPLLIPAVLRQTATLAAVCSLTLGVGALCLLAGHSIFIAASVAAATAVVSLCILVGGR
jgi:hypothetical protein